MEERKQVREVMEEIREVGRIAAEALKDINLTLLRMADVLEALLKKVEGEEVEEEVEEK